MPTERAFESSFQCKSDNGTIYEVHRIIHTTWTTGTYKRGDFIYTLANGEAVSMIDESTFEIVSTDEVIRKIV